MGRNVFVSYKFGDSNVLPLRGEWSTTARCYVNEIERLLTNNGHAYYGEHQDEDLSYWSDEQIYQRLKNKIFPTSCTIVLISPNMREKGRLDKSQWIPWEISYSLKEVKRADKTSRTNAVLGVVLPDINGSYEYILTKRTCCPSGCTHFNTANLFTIIRENTFNRKRPEKYDCNQRDTIQKWPYSYIHIVSWETFINDMDAAINSAISIRERIGEFDIRKEIK